eukprot:522752-Pleurochrysis_carterae.AAC.1
MLPFNAATLHPSAQTEHSPCRLSCAPPFSGLHRTAHRMQVYIHTSAFMINVFSDVQTSKYIPKLKQTFAHNAHTAAAETRTTRLSVHVRGGPHGAH